MGHGDGSGRIVSPDDVDDTGATILHVDMDAFYAAVEVRHDPSLAGKAIIIGAPESRSVVSSASYEARRYGVRAAMPVGRAMALCPHATIVQPHFDRYLEASREVMAIFRDITPLVEPLSIDEAFLDVGGVRRLWGTPAHVARMLRARVLSETGLVCSVGAAATKHVAKMASTLSKPDGLLVIAAAQTQAFLLTRPIRAVWGIGPKAGELLENRGIRSVADILATPDAVLDRALGPRLGARIRDLARGIDPRDVETEHAEKSIGHEETFHSDVADVRVLEQELRGLADRVATRLRRGNWEARTVAIKVRTSDFATQTRSTTLAEPTNVGQRIGEEAIGLLAKVPRELPVRLIGVRAERLVAASGADGLLWDDDGDWRRIDEALDGARARFGTTALTRASVLGGRRDIGALPTNPRDPG